MNQVDDAPKATRRKREHAGRLARAVALATAVFIAGAASTAEASHFRFAHNTWSLVSGTTVEFTSTQAWRSDGLDLLSINFGDASSGVGSPVTIGTFTDIAGEQYTILQYKVQHTYPSEGPFTAVSESCCRIYSLLNASGASERIETVVDLRNGNTGSPVGSIPVIVQMAQGAVASIPLPIADPDGDSFTCRMATAGESQIPSVASAGGNDLTVSSDCILSWDTTATSVGDKYAAQVAIEESHAGNTGRVALDFIVEITSGNAPECSGISGNHIVNVGQTFTANVTGTDEDGDDLTIGHLGLPPGATLDPAAGTTQAEPFTVEFEWTPQASDAGTAHAVTLLYTDPDGLQGSCAFSLNVPATVCGNEQVEPPFEECDDGNTAPGDGCDANCQIEEPICGDGITQAGEQCDDGNTTPGDGCDEQCQTEDRCLAECASPAALHVNAANKVLVGTPGSDILCGDDRNNVLRGRGGNDVMCGFGGKDRLYSHRGVGADYLDGGDGNDILRAEDGDDVLIGGEGNDTLVGHGGNDVLDGGPGDDRIRAGAGDDTADGGPGKDIVNGERGVDTCIGEKLQNCP